MEHDDLTLKPARFPQGVSMEGELSCRSWHLRRNPSPPQLYARDGFRILCAFQAAIRGVAVGAALLFSMARGVEAAIQEEEPIARQVGEEVLKTVTDAPLPTQATLRARLDEVIEVWNLSDFETAYNEFLTSSQRGSCSLAQFTEWLSSVQKALEGQFGSHRASVVKASTDVRGGLGRISYELSLGDGVIGTQSDYWLFENGDWRDIDEDERSPCFDKDEYEQAEVAFVREPVGEAVVSEPVGDPIVSGVAENAPCSARPSLEDIPARPSDDDGCWVLVQVIEESNSPVRLLSFRKTNGQAREYMGVKVYVMFYEAEVEMTDVGYVEALARARFGGASLLSANRQREPFELQATYSRGERHSFTGELGFALTENGWVGERCGPSC